MASLSRFSDVLEEELNAHIQKAVPKETKIATRSEEHTSELQSRQYLVCRLLLEKKKKKKQTNRAIQ